jgi:hypothetical protein
VAVHVLADLPHEAVLDLDDPAVLVVVDLAVAQLAAAARLDADDVAFREDVVDRRLRIAVLEETARAGARESRR